MATDIDTAALARMAASTGPATAAPRREGTATGNNVAPTGQGLPVDASARPDLDLQKLVDELNARLAERQRNLSFHVDESSGRTVITVLDGQTRQVVRQIPSEEVLAFARAVEELGILFEERV